MYTTVCPSTRGFDEDDKDRQQWRWWCQGIAASQGMLAAPSCSSMVNAEVDVKWHAGGPSRSIKAAGSTCSSWPLCVQHWRTALSTRSHRQAPGTLTAPAPSQNPVGTPPCICLRQPLPPLPARPSRRRQGGQPSLQTSLGTHRHRAECGQILGPSLLGPGKLQRRTDDGGGLAGGVPVCATWPILRGKQHQGPMLSPWRVPDHACGRFIAGRHAGPGALSAWPAPRPRTLTRPSCGQGAQARWPWTWPWFSGLYEARSQGGPAMALSSIAQG